MNNLTEKKLYRISTVSVITLMIAFYVMCAYNIGYSPDLEKYDLKSKLPAPQNEIVVHDWDIEACIKYQQKYTADFNRMYNELKGWKKINWPYQPLDDNTCYPIFPGSTKKPTMREYHAYIRGYEESLYQVALKRCKTKYRLYKGNQK